MTKRTFLKMFLPVALAFFSVNHLFSQVTIGAGTPPQEFSVLELIGNAKSGIRLPQLNTQQRDAMQASTAFQNEKSDKALGLKIFNIDTLCEEFWNGTKWISNCYDADELSCIISGINCKPCGMPATTSPQDFPVGSTVSMLTASGAPDAVFFWYDSPSATTPLDPLKPLEDGKTYYVTQAVNKPGGGSESPLAGAPSTTVKLHAAACIGTVIFKEDFDSYDDGLNPASPAYSTVPLAAGMTVYGFQDVPFSGEGLYAIVKDAYSVGSPIYLNGFRDDHTYPNDSTKGRFFFANGSKTSGSLLYKQDIPDLCPGSRLLFSFWARANSYCNLDLDIFGSSGSLLQQPFTTGVISGALPNNSDYQYFSFPFDVPVSENSIRFEIYNRSTATGGNDFALDDIEVRFCAPPITIIGSTDRTITRGETLTLTGYFTADGGSSMGLNPTLTARWEYSTTGDPNDPAAWQEMPNSSAGSSISGNFISNTLTKFFAMPNDAGYYRMAVGIPTTINTENCKAKSPVIKVTVK